MDQDETQMTRMGKILTKEKWTAFIIRYTKELARLARFREAITVLKYAQKSSVYFHDEANTVIFHLYTFSRFFLSFLVFLFPFLAFLF